MGFDIKNFLKTLTGRPGIYKMLDSQGKIIYIGKAKNLKNRVSSYFGNSVAPLKQRLMIGKIASIEVTITHTEGEALLLESQQIKKVKPHYNICLRDDKSYPYLYISSNHDFPQITFHRGAKKKLGMYFGPYPSVGAVKETLQLLQKIFPVRQCTDSYFNNRSRACLQYQIRRCTAPCVGLIEKTQYAEDLKHTILFLQGKNDLLINKLITQMEIAAKALEFERATILRNQISRLRLLLEKHFVHGEKGDVDIIACASHSGIACVQVFFIRHGQNLGNKQFFPKLTNNCSPEAVLQAFIPQYYLDKQVALELIISHPISESSLLAKALSKSAKHLVSIKHKVRGERLKWLQIAQINAKNALQGKLADKQSTYTRFLSLKQELGCLEIPKRLECFDVSHTQGDYTVASCVVFNQEGPLKSAYRRFNIQNIIPGDDCAAIYQAVYRHYKHIKKTMHLVRDIVFIDGSKGQVNADKNALRELKINNVMIIGVAKGVQPKAGTEKLISAALSTLNITPGASALLLIQHIRDESHRFAITGHRQLRAKAKQESALESIMGLGPKKRQSLLKQFGGLQGVSGAGIDALSSISGISKHLAQQIYDNFHY